MSQYFENKRLKEILEDKMKITAEEMVHELNIDFNPDEKEIVYQKVRKAMRQFIDINDGKRENFNSRNELLYEL